MSSSPGTRVIAVLANRSSSSRMHVGRLIVTGLMLLGVSALDVPGVSAHPVREFSSCVTSGYGTRCRSSYAFLPGVTVIVRGRVRPRHSDESARVWRQRPGGHVWRKVGVVDVNASGGMAWRWETNSEHIDRDDPWRFRFVIAGHGVSTIAEAYISHAAE